ncbi:MAG: hypothetical protein ABEJ44_07495 [Halanaeroarchaeum sp.]
MNRPLTILLAMATIVGMATPVVAVADPSALAGTDDATLSAQITTTENATANESIPPGVMLAGSIVAHQAEIQGTVEHRAFGLKIAEAASNESKAEILNRVAERLRERQRNLSERNETLRRALANESITPSQYRVRMTELVARAAAVRTMANDTAQVAERLPRETLEANGVNVTAIQRLRERAHNMTGPETARIARRIAGNSVGAPMGPPGNVPGFGGGPMGPGMNESTPTGPGGGPMGPGMNESTPTGPGGGPMGPGMNESTPTGPGGGPMGPGTPGGPFQGSGDDDTVTTTASTNDSSTRAGA